jgi:hypothetical protein
MEHSDPKELIASEMGQLEPFLKKEEIDYVTSQLTPLLGSNIKATIGLDLEQLQIADYPSLFAKRPELIELLRFIQDSGVFNQEELNFLTLRSLVTLTWPRPSSTEEVKLMADVESNVNRALFRLAHHITEVRPHRTAWVPYWARLAHLDLLNELPETLRHEYSPERLPTILMRSRDVNASTCMVPGAQVIVLDYALEPFLKSMNVFLVSYYESRDLAGPRRLGRALAELIPRVLFFKGATPAYALPPFGLLFGEKSLWRAKVYTDQQIRFLVAHELAHILFSHPGLRAALPCISELDPTKQVEQIQYEHMYEHEADVFGLNWQRSLALNAAHRLTQAKRSKKKRSEMGAKGRALDLALNTYLERFDSVRTLFLVMDFVEVCYGQLSSMVPNLPKRATYSHPAPTERWNRIQKHCIFDAPIGSEFTSYSDYILKGALNLLQTLSGRTIHEIVEEARTSESTNSYTPTATHQSC